MIESLKKIFENQGNFVKIWNDSITLLDFSKNSHHVQLILTQADEKLKLFLKDLNSSLSDFPELFSNSHIKRPLDEKVHLMKEYDIEIDSHLLSQKILHKSLKIIENLEILIDQKELKSELFNNDQLIFIIDSFEKFKKFFDVEFYELYNDPFMILFRSFEDDIQLEIISKPDYDNKKTISVKGNYVPKKLIKEELKRIYDKWLTKQNFP
jgi:hypothetical protein